jgi:CRP/FNR family nitrogen fixation transcriptional regulator
MTLERSRFHDEFADRSPPKHDANWAFGFARQGSLADPTEPSRLLELGERATVFEEGDRAGATYMIIEGAVMLSKLLPDGRRQILELLGPGDVFGITTTVRFDCTAETLHASRIRSYDRSVIERSPTLQISLASRMTAQICALHDHSILLGRKSAIERVATFVMQLIRGRGGVNCLGPTSPKDEIRVRVSLTRLEIADYLGLTLETVSRAFSQLKREGTLAYDRHDEMTIPNVCGLCHRTGAH